MSMQPNVICYHLCYIDRVSTEYVHTQMHNDLQSKPTGD